MKEEEERRRIVEEERQRILQQNVERLIGHIPKGVLSQVFLIVFPFLPIFYMMLLHTLRWMWRCWAAD